MSGPRKPKLEVRVRFGTCTLLVRNGDPQIHVADEDLNPTQRGVGNVTAELHGGNGKVTLASQYLQFASECAGSVRARRPAICGTWVRSALVKSRGDGRRGAASAQAIGVRKVFWDIYAYKNAPSAKKQNQAISGQARAE